MTDGERDDEGRPLPRSATGRDLAPMALGDLATDGQTDAGAFIFTASVQPLEWDKNAIQVLLIEPDTIVFHQELTAWHGGAVGGWTDSWLWRTAT